jgi:hypothetical protein
LRSFIPWSATRDTVLGTPADAWYSWVGLGAASVVVLGVVVGLPAAAPPDPGPVAGTIDAVASSPHQSSERIEVVATEIRLDPYRIGLRGQGGSAHATIAYGPVTPVDGGQLAAVLAGTAPEGVFEDPGAFADALREARTGPRSWQPAPDRLRVRRVTWEGIDATLVG